jgi:uncharacterized Zn finger protein
MSWYEWRPYLPVGVRRARAVKKMEKLRKKGIDITPVEITGRKIAKTFWGEAWCDHLESFSDYANRLPRGRTYVRNGSVCHLAIGKGEIDAMVSGSELYTVKITIHTLARKKWTDVKKRCAGQIGSLLELLEGRLSKSVMSVVTDRNQGLFPLPKEIRLECNCPDWAVMCKHVAAVLYGVGARLDEHPELLFLLRGVDHEELIETEVGVTAAAGSEVGRRRIAEDALADVFGIEMSETVAPFGAKTAARREDPAPKAKKTSKVSADGKVKRNVDHAVGKPRVRKRLAHPSWKVKAEKPARSARNNQTVTGKAVSALRAKFGMSQSQFARLLGVSAPSVANWEKQLGPLSLQTRTRDAWNTVKRLTKLQARGTLSNSEGPTKK